MKIGQFFKNLASGSVILAALACPVFNSCADFGAELEDMKGDIADLENRVTALEEKLNTDLTALQALLEGKIEALDGRVDGIEGDLTDLIATVDGLVTVKDTKKNSDGSLDITLTDGTKFTVYPEYEADYSGIVTTTEIEGVLYWAIFDENGKAVAVTDEDGMPVPVVEAVPQVKNEDGLFYVSFDGGETWEPTGVADPCVFADAEVVYTDNYTDEEEATGWYEETPMYVVLTLADGNTITVTLDGAASFMFASNYGGPISTQYIACGNTTAIPVVAVNVQDWIKEVPAGWTIKEDTRYLDDYGQAEFFVTAPTAEAIASGAAVAEGLLKVLAVAEGGKSITATVKLTTSAFETVAAGGGKLTVDMNSGVGGYLVGISTVEDYDAEAIIAELKPVVEYVPDPDDWTDFGWSPWYVLENATSLDDNYFDGSISDYAIADLLSDVELADGGQYIVWVLALESWTDDATWTSGYNLGTIVSVPYFNVSIELETTALTFNDIQITAEFKGVTSYYGAFSMVYSGELNKEGILAEFNSSLTSSWGAPMPLLVNDEYVEGWDNGVFTGDPNTLVQGYQNGIEPNSSYYLYLIPVVEGKTKYTMADVFWYEWTTEPIIAGGSVTLSEVESELTFNSISVSLEASEEDAVMIYYDFVDPAMISTIEDKAAYLLERYPTEGSSCVVNKANVKPSTTYTLLAVAVDKYGCYGEVFQKDYTTKAMEYSSVTVSAEVVGTPSTEGLVKLSATGDVETYIYWYGERDGYYWTNDYYFGGSAESASAYIALNPNMYFFDRVAASELPADGVKMEGLTVGVSYVFVVSAQLADGSFTKAAVVDFEPALDLGNFVYATDDNGAENPIWAAAKPVVTYETDSVGDFTSVYWTVELPEGFTGKTACFHSDYLSSYPTAKDKASYILTSDVIGCQDIVPGETYANNYASKGYNIYTVICDADGNYYETYVTELDITGGFGI